jgi:hypothetical protein
MQQSIFLDDTYCYQVLISSTILIKVDWQLKPALNAAKKGLKIWLKCSFTSLPDTQEQQFVRQRKL